MADNRSRITTTEDARKQLGDERTLPSWRENTHSLPFGDLSDDEFEVLCYLLLKAEHPDDEIVYYGKTKDLGRDIVHKLSDGTQRLIQCKKYTNNVGVGQVRQELAKLVANLFENKFPIAPSEVCFYVVPDLSGPARDLVENQATWKEVAPLALEEHLGVKPKPELLAFAREWWKLIPTQSSLALTDRCKRQSAILDEFFRTRKVIEASLVEIKQAFGEAAATLVRADGASRLSRRTTPEPVGLDAIRSSFSSASRVLLGWPTTLGGNTWLERPELAAVRDKVASTSSSTTLVLGPPGSGKSALLARLGKAFTDDGCTVLGVKADFLEKHIASEAELSEFLRLPALLTDCVTEASAQGPVVVLLDQLDALADLADLHSERLSVLLNLAHAVAGQGNVHLIASCREFEFHHDSRLSRIDADSTTLELPDWATISQLLKDEHGIEAASWPSAFCESLRIPQHLKVFLSYVTSSSAYNVYHSYQQLLDDLWEQRVANPGGLPGRAQLLMDMAKEMAEGETHWLPIARFDNELALIQALEAAEILHRVNGRARVGFRHQTFFEHARARAFAGGVARLAPYVLERQNALFVRPTLWATLGYLRTANPGQYFQEMSDLFSANLRLHVRRLLIDFLGSVEEPTDEEQQYLQQLLDDPGVGPKALLAIAGNEGWFHRLKDSHFPTLMQEPVDAAWGIAHVLKSALTFAKTDVLVLLRRHWLPSADRDTASWHVYRNLSDWDVESVGDICAIVDRTEIDDMYVMEMASVVSAGSPALAPKIVATRLRRELRLLDSAPPPEPDPLAESDNALIRAAHTPEYQRKRDYDGLLAHRTGFHDLPEVALAAPGDFIREVWPWFVEVHSHSLWPRHHIIYTFRDTYSLTLDLDADRMVNLQIVSAVDSAIKAFARDEPKEYVGFVDQWLDYDSKAVQRLLCRGLTEIAAVEAQAALAFLTNDRRRLALGGHRNYFGDSQALITAVCSVLASDDMRRLEAAIVGWSDYVDSSRRRPPRPVCPQAPPRRLGWTGGSMASESVGRVGRHWNADLRDAILAFIPKAKAVAKSSPAASDYAQLFLRWAILYAEEGDDALRLEPMFWMGYLAREIEFIEGAGRPSDAIISAKLSGVLGSKKGGENSRGLKRGELTKVLHFVARRVRAGVKSADACKDASQQLRAGAFSGINRSVERGAGVSTLQRLWSESQQ